MGEGLKMFFTELWKWICDNTALALFIIGLILEPTKLKPIRRFLNWIGKCMNNDLYTKVDGIEKEIGTIKTDIDQVKEDIDLNEADRIRWEVLAFAEEIRRGMKHSEESFKHIMELCDKYRKLIERTNTRNNVFEVAEELIKKTYASCMCENNFV